MSTLRKLEFHLQILPSFIHTEIHYKLFLPIFYSIDLFSYHYLFQINISSLVDNFRQIILLSTTYIDRFST